MVAPDFGDAHAAKAAHARPVRAGAQAAALLVHREQRGTTAMNDTAFTKNTHASPTEAISNPAMAGPVMRAELPTALLSATAFDRRSRPTISSTNA